MNSGSKDLDALRETASKALISLLWLHVPIAAVIGMARGTDWLMPTILMIAFAAAATLSWRSVGNGLSTHLVIAVALMGGVSVFTFQLSGHAWQVDSHMYFFAALASLAAYCDYRPIIAGTIAVALHHLALNFILPAAVYPGGADLGRVVLHAVILLIEAGVLIWLARKLSHLFETTTQKTAEAEAANAAEARANAQRAEADQKAKQERDAAMRELAAGFERKVGHIVEAVAVAAREMQGMSSSMSNSSGEAARKTAAAATASTQASLNVGTVASAAGQLTASISEIAQQAMRSAKVTGKAADEARRTNTVVEGLAAGTHKIGEVSTQIQSIQAATGEAVGAIQSIGGTIAEINEISNAIATAVEQQGAATREISGNVQQAANGTKDVNDNIVGVAKASGELGTSASKLLDAANGLSSQSERLKLEVDSFLGSVRAA